MDLFFRLFDLFTETAKKLADYVPQSGSDVIQIFQQLGRLVIVLNLWIAENIGINLQAVLINIGRLALTGINFFLDIIRQLAERI